MRRILVNATQQEELRVAMVDGQKLYDLDIELPSRAQKKANIYKAVISRIEPSLEAAFVNYGAERHGFLPFKEIARDFLDPAQAEEPGRPNVKDGIEVGQELAVQVEREERGNKGAALTTFISLAGRYLVLMPNNPRAGGVSRRIEGEERNQVRDALDKLEGAGDVGVIVRTAGVGRSAEELQWDLDYLLTLWRAITKATEEKAAPFLIYQESNLIIRALRDHLRSDIGEIIIDDQEIYAEANDFMQQVMPHNLHKLKHYEDHVPLFNRYQIESQIESAFERLVSLPAGGAIVIDHTEALLTIDINSARATRGSDIEETALQTNLEAADEIARQLRLRDIGGLIVIDFIDMAPNKNQREVENRLREALKVDRARVQIGRISRFGMLEMSRQRLRPSLGESTHNVCPRCEGTGHIRGIESLALSVLRLMEEEAMKEKTGRVLARLPVEITTFLLNEKRDAISHIEARHKVDLTLVPQPGMETPNFEVHRFRQDDQEIEGKNSYDLIKEPEVEVPEAHKVEDAIESPVVTRIAPTSPAPPPAPPAPEPEIVRPGLFVRLWRSLFGTGDEQSAKPAHKGRRNQRGRRPQGRGQDNRGRARGQDNRGRGQDNRGRSQDNRGRAQTQSKQNENQEKTTKQAANRNRRGRSNTRRRKPQDNAQPNEHHEARTAAQPARPDRASEASSANEKPDWERSMRDPKPESAGAAPVPPAQPASPPVQPTADAPSHVADQSSEDKITKVS